MKKLLAVLLALSLPSVAHAKVLVVTDHVQLGTPAGQKETNDSDDIATAMLREIFDRYGVEYVFMHPREVKTEFCRSGVFVRDFGTAAASATAYDAVIHMGYRGRCAFTTNYHTTGAYRPDSLNFSAKYPDVPQLFVLTQAIQSGTVPPCIATAAADSSGVSDTGNGGAGVPTLLRRPGSPRVFMSAGHHSGMILAPATNGGVRPLLYMAGIHDELRFQLNGIPAPWFDSTSFADTTTLACVWERMNANKTGAAHSVFAQVLGVGPCYDSLGNVQACEGDELVLMCALARLDSLTGGRVFTNKSKFPLTAGIAVFGGFSRGARRSYGGVAPSDTAALSATCDSLAALTPPVPITLGADVDSIATYAADKRWWAKLPRIKYSPMTRCGVADTTRATNAIWQIPVDIFGRYRNRTIYRPLSATDSSISTQYRAAQWKADSTWGRQRVSRVVFAAQDDWTPKNISTVTNGPDSVLLVLRDVCGARGILIDAQRQSADVTRWSNRWTVIGWWPWQREHHVSPGGAPFRMLAHTGWMTAGGSVQSDTRIDSLPPIASTVGSAGPNTQGIPFYEMARFTHGLFMRQYRDVDYMQRDGASLDQFDNFKPRVDMFDDLKRASVFKCHVTDLAGNPSNPARSGYWVIKSIVNAFDTINSLAGRTLVELRDLEDVAP